MTPRRRKRETSGRRLCPAAVALCLGLATTTGAAAGPIAMIASGADVALPAGVHVLDIRDEDTCFLGAPPRSHCLPAEQLLSGDGGAPLGFHALRWALGTLGLTGAETLVIYPGDAVGRDDALAAAALLYLTGQAEVLVHEGPAQEIRDGAQVRALWREVIYTAPMRVDAMALADAPEGRLRDRLRAFATDGGRVDFAAGE